MRYGIGKLAILAAAVPLATFVQAQNVTLQLGASWASDAVEALGKASGQKLAVNSNVKRDLLVLFVTDRPAKEVMDQMASVLNAEWRMDGDTLTLTRFNGAENQEREQVNRTLAGRLQGIVRDKIRAQSSAGAYDEKQAKEYAKASSELGGSEQSPEEMQKRMREFEKLQSLTPQSRAMAQLLSKMDMMSLASMPDNSRRVFSLTPTGMQFRLPGDTMRIANQLAQDEKVFQSAVGSGPEVSVSGGNLNISRREGGRDQRQPEIGPPTQALLVANRYFGAVMMELTVFDARGNRVTGAHEFLHIEEGNPSKSPEWLTKESGSALELSPVSRELLGAVKNHRVKASGGAVEGQMVFAVSAVSSDGEGAAPMVFGMSSEPPKLNAAGLSLKEILINPDKYEPLGFFVAEGLRDFGKNLNANVIACVQDSSFARFAGELATDNPTTRQIEAALRIGQHSLELKDGWLRVKAEDAPAMRRERVIRRNLSVLQKHLDSTGTWTLDQRAEYAATAPSEASQESLDMLYTSLLNPYVSREVGSDLFGAQRSVLKLYGQLNTKQRQDLFNKAEITVAGLALDARATLDELIFWSQDGPNLQRRGGGGRGQGQGQIELPADVMFTMGQERFQEERTNLLPQGLPQMGTISLSLADSNSAYARSSDGRERVMSANDVAQNQLSQEGGGIRIANFQPEVVTYSGFKTVHAVKHNLIFTVGPNYTMRRTLKDLKYDPKAPFGAYDNLPAEFRKEAAASLEQMRKMSGRIRIGGAGDGAAGAGIP